MAWSSEHKEKSRQRILSSAAKLFTRQGYEEVGINDVMQDADLTRGAFYAHFKSKSELYAESILTAGQLARDRLLDLSASSDNQRDNATALVKHYLSTEHKTGEHTPCPLAHLATDIGQRDESVKNTYTQAFKTFVNHMKLGDAETSKEDMLRRAVLMVGGLAISKALNDEALVDELFSACQNGVMNCANNKPINGEPQS